MLSTHQLIESVPYRLILLQVQGFIVDGLAGLDLVG